MFQQINSTIAVQCLATRGGELWACSDAKSGFIVGVSKDDGAHFCPKMKEITSVSAPMACSTSTSATLGCGATIRGSECKPSFDMFCQLYSFNSGQCQPDDPSSLPAECRPNPTSAEPAYDGADAGIADGGVATRPKSTGCGCSTARSGGASGVLVLPLAWAWSRFQRRSERRRRRSENANAAAPIAHRMTRSE
jgi:hypothetical protein